MRMLRTVTLPGNNGEVIRRDMDKQCTQECQRSTSGNVIIHMCPNYYNVDLITLCTKREEKRYDEY